VNSTPEQWAKVSANAVVGGSSAQARNVLEMALQDIARMGEEIERLRVMMRRERLLALIIPALEQAGSGGSLGLADYELHEIARDLADEISTSAAAPLNEKTTP